MSKLRKLCFAITTAWLFASFALDDSALGLSEGKHWDDKRYYLRDESSPSAILGSTNAGIRRELFEPPWGISVDQGRASRWQKPPVNPVMFNRKLDRVKRKFGRMKRLIGQEKQISNQMQASSLTANSVSISSDQVKMKYSIWRREFESQKSDSMLKLMQDQIEMAKAYASIAKSNNKVMLYNSLMNHLRESQLAVEDVTSDVELLPSALARAQVMGHILSRAKEQLYECLTVLRTLRAMLQLNEDSVNSLKKKSAFLVQVAAKSTPQSLHCFHLHLAADYYLHHHQTKEHLLNKKLEDSSRFHYAIFSDNVLATSVVINSTIMHVRDPEKHVFHVVTDALNFAAMKMWYIHRTPENATVDVQNIENFKWLNVSYCSVLRQLDSARAREFYFKANHPFSVNIENLKYRNPKYLSMLNHLRFYLPEVFPKIDKILFLDDDIVVQKDLTPLWSINLHGMVNGAVETCKESFHRLDKYLNFSNPRISEKFDPNSCGWAYGMNIFDLKEWKKRNITGIYHHWQDLNEDRMLWKLGTLPPGLITFYNLTYPLDRSWHALGLGYDPALNLTELDNAAVVHYNGNYKPWLDLAIVKYKSYWTRFVNFGDPYLQFCNING